MHSDADLEFAAERCAVGGFSYAGQTCISVQRIVVERSVFGKFTELLLSGISKLKMGDPMDDSVDLGPMIRESDAIRAYDWVQEALRGGARLLVGGKRSGSMLEAYGADRDSAGNEGELSGDFWAGGDCRGLRFV